MAGGHLAFQAAKFGLRAAPYIARAARYSQLARAGYSSYQKLRNQFRNRNRMVKTKRKVPLSSGNGYRTRKIVRRRKTAYGKIAAKWGVYRTQETKAVQLQADKGRRAFGQFGDDWSIDGVGLFGLVEVGWNTIQDQIAGNFSNPVKPLSKVYLHNVRHHIEMVNSFQLPCLVTVYFLDYKRKAKGGEDPIKAIDIDYTQKGIINDKSDQTQKNKDVFGSILSGETFKKTFKCLKKQTKVLGAGEHWAITYVQNVERAFTEQTFSELKLGGTFLQEIGEYQYAPKFTPPVLVVCRGLPAHEAENESTVSLSGARLDMVYSYNRTASFIPVQKHGNSQAISQFTLPVLTNPEQATMTVEETKQDE